MLELTAEQVAALAEVDAKGFVERVRDDLVKADPRLAEDSALSRRLWRAFRAVRAFGILDDDNLHVPARRSLCAGFLREAGHAHSADTPWPLGRRAVPWLSVCRALENPTS
jgi:hypothetical protein